MGTNQSTDAVLKWRLALIVVIGAWILSLVLLLLSLPMMRLVRCPLGPVVIEYKDNSRTYEMSSFSVTAPLTWDGFPSKDDVEQQLSFSTRWGRVIFRSYHDERPDALEIWAKDFFPSSQQRTRVAGHPAIKQVVEGKFEIWVVRWDTRILVVNVQYTQKTAEAQKEVSDVLNTLEL
ncbi:MAG: hypothetical protein ACUVSV_10395 [Armatimonadota bacterium]